jgi:GNAT superfamily N-acetyltransferase
MDVDELRLIPEVAYELVTPETLSSRDRAVLWGLTLPLDHHTHDSDMRMYLRELSEGRALDSLVVLARGRGAILGWAYLELWRGEPLIGCYVRPEYRCGGLGRGLLRHLWPSYRQRHAVQPRFDRRAARWFYKVLPELKELPMPGGH